ncbi:MAG TPA: isopentenyl-diphosphate Delta-isomerase [Wenzhouxiangellaceae bacterium]|nr:isopentenyl-diphosphate Delta-isomerase [Wenzhouxiangellaceae bacterium]
MGEVVREKVSFDDEPLILVDENDNEIGYRPKVDCHTGHGTLHRAFSIFLFDNRGRVLLQQRAAGKPLWPLYWSNSCCSHPRRGESMQQALHRRLYEELGVDAELEFVYKFIYQADFGDAGAENELCHVYIGASAGGEVRVHPDEIADWRWVPMDDVTRELENDPARYTPWFKMEWKALMDQWRDRIQSLSERAADA